MLGPSHGQNTFRPSLTRSEFHYLDILRRKARAILDAMPRNGDLYWHGVDGRPCPCAGCCAGWRGNVEVKR